jgi:hypothetical protein
MSFILAVLMSAINRTNILMQGENEKLESILILN